MADTLLEVRNVSKRFGGAVANRNISLAVPEGRIIGLIGPNGSGKTTLFNSIVGHHPIDDGSIRFQGREISKLRVPEIARLGLLRTFQQTRVYDRMTCLRREPARDVRALSARGRRAGRSAARIHRALYQAAPAGR
jgi:branched-chain amino acid transport system ATP-binding protein